MKLNNKGQMLVETLVVSLMIVGVLVFLFVQLRNINQNYKNKNNQNTVDALYAAEVIREFITSGSNQAKLNSTYIAEYNPTNQPYVNLSNCSSVYMEGAVYCSTIKAVLNIKTIVLTEEDTANLVININDSTYNNSTNFMSKKLKDLIRQTKVDKNIAVKRLFVELMDGDVATIKVR